MNLNYETTGINFNSKGKVDEIATPQNIADDMITLFDYTDCNRKIWMDMYCKTGNFLASLKRQGVDKNNMAAICQTLQSQMLVCRKLYGKILPEVEVKINIKSLESCKVTRRGQVYCISNWKDKVKNNHQEAYNIIKFVVMKEMEKTMSLDWTTEENFKINNIIMNPPYNPSDLYIDFIELAHKIASENVVAITPAKWQAKGGDKNKDFRSAIVPYMKSIKYYENPLDIFPNNPMCGDAISYYLINRDKNIDKYINDELEEAWLTRYGLNNTCISIIKRIDGERIVETSDESVMPAKSYFTAKNFGDVSEDSNSKYYMMSSARCIKVNESAFKHTENMDKYKVYIGHFITANPVLHLVEPFVAEVRESCLLGFGTKEKCESIISYYKCKLIWFLVYMVNCGNASKEAFVNVPDPGAFDHIFTDDELYKKYDLTDEEINIIESVIK